MAIFWCTLISTPNVGISDVCSLVTVYSRWLSLYFTIGYLYYLLFHSKWWHHQSFIGHMASQVFMAQISPSMHDEEKQSLRTSMPLSRITFSPEYIHVLGKHDRLGLIEINRILVDLGSALSIMPRRVMHHMGIPTSRFTFTNTMINDFNANGVCPWKKIMLKCQIEDLRSEVTYYIIDASISFNLLLGRP